MSSEPAFRSSSLWCFICYVIVIRFMWCSCRTLFIVYWFIMVSVYHFKCITGLLYIYFCKWVDLRPMKELLVKKPRGSPEMCKQPYSRLWSHFVCWAKLIQMRAHSKDFVCSKSLSLYPVYQCLEFHTFPNRPQSICSLICVCWHYHVAKTVVLP